VRFGEHGVLSTEVISYLRLQDTMPITAHTAKRVEKCRKLGARFKK